MSLGRQGSYHSQDRVSERREIHGEDFRDSQVSLEYSAETNQHKHVHKILKIGDLKQLEGMVSSAHTVVAIGTVTTSQTGKFHNS